jgi:hypothetical protein
VIGVEFVLSSSGSVAIVPIYEADRTRRMLDRVTSTQRGHIFARVTRAGEASRRPYAEKFNGFGGSQQSQLI